MARHAEILYLNTKYYPSVYPNIYAQGNSSCKFLDLTERFETRHPPALFDLVDEEIYQQTIKRINKYVKKEVKTNKKWLYLGLIFGCFPCGFSSTPVSFRYRKVFDGIERILHQENLSTYHELGLHWKLGDENPDTEMKHLLVALVIEYTLAS